MKNHDVAARKCAKCHHVFSKVEHLRRHQRSHTGERPFKCMTCGRTYARSDVLNRHIRNHHLASQGVDGEATRQIQSSNDELTGRNNLPPGTESDGTHIETGNFSSDRPSSSPRNTPLECPTPRDLVINDPAGDDWNNRPVDDMLETQIPCTVGLPDSLENVRALEFTDDHQPLQLTAISTPPVSTSFHALIDPSLGLTQPSITKDTFDAMALDLDFGSAWLDDLLLTPSTSGGRRLNHPHKENISNEQFEQVRRHWPTRRRKATLSPSPVCWDDILLHSEDNIFSSASLKSISTLDPSPQVKSPWGFTEACRHRLAESMIAYASHSANQTNDSHVIPSPRDGPWNGEPPPTDILDLCLDLYFGQFHIHLPFVHPGTFKACHTPSILLFPICVVGMMILDRTAAYKIIADYLPGAIHHCRTELTSHAIRHCSGPDLFAVLGSACLILFIAASTAEIAFEDQRQALYEEAISMAKMRGVFDSHDYGYTLVQAVGDDNVMWKSWARIQSVQRLTGCLILADAYSAQMLGLAPILSPDIVQLPRICPDPLFTVYSSRQWKSKTAFNDPWKHTASVVLDMQSPPPGLTRMELQTAFALFWLRILNHRHRPQRELVPVPETGIRTATLSHENPETDSEQSFESCLALAFGVYETELKSEDANSLILWHYLCLRLTCDLAVVEDAAGRNGPEAAKEAVEKLRLWARSPGARRACLHASQMYIAINNHRKSHGMMLHSEMALFHAALVLGFYLLAAPDCTSSDDACYDIFEEVPWGQVGTLGLSLRSLDQEIFSSVSGAAAFIQKGGPVSFHGAEYCSPYGAARRSFMNFASQLKEVGKWNVEEYCKVLRIISDTLLTPERQDTES
ncbi:hypothetical protein N7499_001050 [Penicillium canescens]|nr:hypothetical protein N7499_001050 [Penicillium canescens]KAJ6173879.1 hypothetical protein N7485_006691 [Penicillium canescens]